MIVELFAIHDDVKSRSRAARSKYRQTMTTEFANDAKVRFTQERLAILTPRDRQGLAGRIGVIQTDKNSKAKPTVYFPAVGKLPEMRLFRVDPRHFELVEAPPAAETTPAVEAGANPTEGGGNLSQSDLDDFFQ